VEAIEHEFVPVLVYNNRSGRDAELLERYHEPAWNNPIVRFFGADGTELLERTAGVYGADEVARRLCAALIAAGRPVPAWLRLAREELARGPRESAVFSMACFWRGEGVLGSIPGVRSTRAGWLDGREVVELEYAPAELPFDDLLTLARTEGCAERVWVAPGARLEAAKRALGGDARELDGAPRPAKPGDHEYYLQSSPLARLPLTALQRVRLNARLSSGRPPEDLLTPSQQALLARLRAHPDRVAGLEPPGDPADLDGLWRRRARLEQLLGD